MELKRYTKYTLPGFVVCWGIRVRPVPINEGVNVSFAFELVPQPLTQAHSQTQVVVAGQDSGRSGVGAFSFAYPTLNFSAPAVINTDGWLYLFGTNFGTTADAITVTLQVCARV